MFDIIVLILIWLLFLKSLLEGEDGGYCPVCLEPLNEQQPRSFSTACNHTFHIDCIAKLEGTTCPVCRSAQAQLFLSLYDNRIEYFNQISARFFDSQPYGVFCVRLCGPKRFARLHKFLTSLFDTNLLGNLITSNDTNDWQVWTFGCVWSADSLAVESLTWRTSETITNRLFIHTRWTLPTGSECGTSRETAMSIVSFSTARNLLQRPLLVTTSAVKVEKTLRS